MRYRTSNPAFNTYFWPDNRSLEKKMSIKGILVKSITSIAIVAFVTACIWKLDSDGFDVSWFNYGGIIAAIILSVIISYKKQLAAYLVPLYAIAKGCFIGGFSAWIRVNYPEMPFQAIGATIVTFLTVFLLYQTRVIVLTNKLKSIIITAASSVFLIYIISWILSIFGIKTFIWGTSWLAIAFSVIAAIVASATLLLDFDFIERKKNHAPKSMEWFATWGLLVSLLWLYVEILRLMKKLAIRF